MLANFTKDSIKKLTSKPFSKMVTAEAEDEVGKTFIELVEKDIDLVGTSLHNFARSVMAEAAWSGLCHVFVDADESGRPYAKIVHPDQILDAQELDGELAILTFIEDRKQMSADGLSVELAKGERTYRKFGGAVEYALFNENAEGVCAQCSEWTRFGLDFIPLFTYYADTDERSGSMTCASPFQDIADLNCLHWQKESDLATIEHVANVPILFGSEMEEDAQIRIGHDRMIVGPEGSSLQYVEHTGSAIRATRESIKSLEFQMQTLGLEFIALNSGSETATGRAISAEGNNSNLAAMAINLGDVIALILKTMASFKLIDLSAKVQIHTDYGVTLTAEQLQALSTARAAGDISQEDYLTELKRRGVLRAGFSFDDNLLRLSEEKPSVKDEVIPELGA